MKSHRVFGPRTETALTPMQVAAAYNFPKVDPKILSQRTIAILELGGAYQLQDIINYCNRYNIPVPTITNVFLDGATAVSDPEGADGEVGLDICVIAGAAPGVNIVVVFAPNTNQGFVDGITKCLELTREDDAISVSWGSPEDQWDAETREGLDSLFKAGEEIGSNTFVAAGDNGSSDGKDGNHVDYPGSSPNVICCGGTSLQLKSDGTRLSEVVWGVNANQGTGGGISSLYPTPADWQTNILPNLTNGRRVPDVSGNADPDTGYLVDIDGQIQQGGGTSAVAPLYAALQCLLNASKNKHVGNMHTKLYANPGCFFDVVSGSNGTYTAGPGFDLCSGLGVINGSQFEKEDI